MKNLLGMTPDEMAGVFTEWNKGELDSFLIEITAKIMAYKVRHICAPLRISVIVLTKKIDLDRLLL